MSLATDKNIYVHRARSCSGRSRISRMRLPPAPRSCSTSNTCMHATSKPQSDRTQRGFWCINAAKRCSDSPDVYLGSLQAITQPSKEEHASNYNTMCAGKGHVVISWAMHMLLSSAANPNMFYEQSDTLIGSCHREWVIPTNLHNSFPSVTPLHHLNKGRSCIC